MFGKARRTTHRQMASRELGESFEHFKQAAAHAARGTGATVGPKVNAARDRVSPAAGKVRDVAASGWGSTKKAALAPLIAASEGAQEAGKATRKAKDKNLKALDKKARDLDKKAAKAMKKDQSGGRSSKFGKLLIVGALVGAAGALVMRRRKQQQWDEYDPGRPVGGAHTEERAVTESMQPASLAPNAVGTLEDPTPPDTSLTVTDPIDQTSSAMHSPTVARMAEGTAPTDELRGAGSASHRSQS